MRVVAIIPAKDEEATIGACIEHLQAPLQTRPPDDLYVALDPGDPTDHTEDIAWSLGVECLYSEGNRHKKAGNLNQAIRSVEGLLDLEGEDALLVVDADSYLDPDFIRHAVAALEADPSLGAVGGTFRGRGNPPGASAGQSYLSFCQQSEFIRYQRDTARLKGKALTLTGTATMFRMGALRDVAASRPTGEGSPYTTSNLTEDLEVCVCLMHIGWSIRAPKELTLSTEVMTSWDDLSRQRLRWREGAVRTVAEYGFVRGCRELYARLVYGFVGILVLFAYLATLAYFVVAGEFELLPFWAGVTTIFAAEQAVTVWRGGWFRALVGATLIVELPYMLFLQLTNFEAYLRVLLGAPNETGEW